MRIATAGRKIFLCVYFGIARRPLLCTAFGQFLTIFRVYTVLYDHSSCLIGSVCWVHPPGGADRHGRSHGEPVLRVWGGWRELLSLCVCAKCLWTDSARRRDLTARSPRPWAWFFNPPHAGEARRYPNCSAEKKMNYKMWRARARCLCVHAPKVCGRTPRLSPP